MSPTTTTTTTTKTPEAKTITAFDRPVRLRGAEQKFAPVERAADLLDNSVRGPHHFAPQLIETTRRSRRDDGGGLRPADRTDATPYARHGYSGLRSRMRRRNARNVHALAGGATRGEGSKDVEMKERDAALAVFPNSRPREGGAAHFYFHSDDDTASESRLSFGPAADEPRRQSTDMSWWHGVQEGAEGDGPADAPPVERDVESEPEYAMPKWAPTDKKRRVTKCPAQVTAAADTPLLAPKPRPPFKETPPAFNTAGEKEVDPEFEVMRRAASPPLLGSDLVFPRCESPETCRLTTDLPFTQRATEEKRRDPTQKCGLWGGYCFKKQDESPVVDANKLTPPGNSGLWPGRNSRSRADAPSPPPTPRGMWAAPRSPTPPSQGLNPFQDVPVQTVEPPLCPKPSLSPEEKERRIDAEFTDAFVTQLYNYLSLGYPVTARAFDEELCAMSGVQVNELRGRDEEVMRRGHVCDTEVERCPAERQCPRWRALKAYVRQWARGQDDLERGGNGGVGMRIGVGVWGGRGSWRP